MAKELSVSDVFANAPISVYGNLITDFPFTPKQAEEAGLTPGESDKDFRIAKIKAYRFASDRCVVLPVPTIMPVYGPGVELEEPECGLSPGEVLKWSMPFDAKVLALQPSHGPAQDVLESLAKRGIDGGIQLDNPRYENGSLCIDIRIWGKIEVLGFKEEFDERFPACVSVGCVTVWDVGIARVELCYQPPKKLCAKLCVGKFGIEKCWDACVTIPIAMQESAVPSCVPESSPCGCQPAAGIEGEPISSIKDACVDVTISNGKACLNIPGYGSQCISVPDAIPNGTVARACIDICKRWNIPCGAKAYIEVAGETVASKKWGCC